MARWDKESSDGLEQAPATDEPIISAALATMEACKFGLEFPNWLDNYGAETLIDEWNLPVEPNSGWIHQAAVSELCAGSAFPQSRLTATFGFRQIGSRDDACQKVFAVRMSLPGIGGRIARPDMESDERSSSSDRPNQARLELSGAHVIGSADECDVNFSDALVAPRHLQSNSASIVAAADGGVRRRFHRIRVNHQFFQFVTAEAPIFCPAGREWPQGVPGPLPPLQPETETQPESAAPESPAPSTKGPEKPKDEASPTDRAKKVALLTFLLFGVLAVSSFLLMSLDRRDPPPPATAESILSGVKAMVQKQPNAEAVTVGIRNRGFSSRDL